MSDGPFQPKPNTSFRLDYGLSAIAVVILLAIRASPISPVEIAAMLGEVAPGA